MACPVQLTPFPAAVGVENNIRPAQWLGLLKILAAWGAEFYYAGFFSLGVPFPNPSNWIWQAAMPAYAQAITSQYSELLFDGAVINANAETSYSGSIGATHGNLLWAGAMNHVALARKHKTKEVYVVAAAIMRNSNIKNNSKLEADVTIVLPRQTAGGDAPAAVLRVPIRLQGSVFILDRTKHPETLVQLDGFHEATHPLYWAKETYIEAELCDLMRPLSSEHLSTDGWAPLSRVHTEHGSSDFRFTSYVSLRGINESVSYEVFRAQPAATRVYVWLRLRSAVSGDALEPALTVSILDSEVHTAVVLSAWHWRRISLTTTPRSDISIIVTIHGTRTGIDIDQLIVAADKTFAPRDEELNVAAVRN